MPVLKQPDTHIMRAGNLGTGAVLYSEKAVRVCRTPLVFSLTMRSEVVYNRWCIIVQIGICGGKCDNICNHHEANHKQGIRRVAKV